MRLSTYWIENKTKHCLLREAYLNQTSVLHMRYKQTQLYSLKTNRIIKYGLISSGKVCVFFFLGC